jgi:predicted porin
MKKSLLAVAAIGAFASAAQAQSSVTVYGILDEGFVGSNQRLQAGSTVNKATTSGIAGGNQSTNRLGFKGTEDLGGGTSAFFTYEIAVGMNDANSLTTVSNQNRQAFVGLAKKGLGNFAMGTQYTPIHGNVGATSGNGQNNVMGDIIYTSASTRNYDVNNAASATPNGSMLSSSNAGYTVRTANMLKFQSENISGFEAQAFFTANGTNTTQTASSPTAQTGGKNDRNGWGGAVNFSIAKFMATANYQSFKADNPFTGANGVTTGTPAVYGSAAQSGVNISDKQYYFGATYDFGILKAYAQYINRKAASEIDSNSYMKRSAQQIGVKAYLTPVIESWASIGSGSYSAMNTVENKQNMQAYQLGTNYYLSKRTNLYAIYGANNASYNGNNAANSAYNGNQYALGLRHTF